MGNKSSQEKSVKHFSKRLQNKFQVSPDEIFVESFLCALISKILIQGELYITPSKLIFHSPFNNRTLFGETVHIVEYQNITYVEKTHGVFGLQNSIYIETSTEEFTFTSFLFRDQAYNVINQSWVNYLDSIAHTLKFKDSILKSPTPRKNPRSLMQTITFSEMSEEGDANGNYTYADNEDIREKSPAELLAIRRRKVLDGLPGLGSFRTLAYKNGVKNIDMHQFFNVILSDNPVKLKGKEYPCWWHIFALRTGAPEAVTVTKWEPKPPEGFRQVKHLLNYEAPFCKRVIRGKKPLKGGGWFTPKYIEFEDTQKLYILDQKEIVLVSDVKFLSSFPFSDSFEYLNCYIFHENDQNEVTLEYRYSMNFIKYCFFQGMIERQTAEEQAQNGVTVEAIMREMRDEGYFNVEVEQEVPSDSWTAANTKLDDKPTATPKSLEENFASFSPAPVTLVDTN